MKSSQSYICLNWLSRVLVGVGGSNFVGKHNNLSHYTYMTRAQLRAREK